MHVTSSDRLGSLGSASAVTHTARTVAPSPGRLLSLSGSDGSEVLTHKGCGP